MIASFANLLFGLSLWKDRDYFQSGLQQFKSAKLREIPKSVTNLPMHLWICVEDYKDHLGNDLYNDIATDALGCDYDKKNQERAMQTLMHTHLQTEKSLYKSLDLNGKVWYYTGLKFRILMFNFCKSVFGGW